MYHPFVSLSQAIQIMRQDSPHIVDEITDMMWGTPGYDAAHMTREELRSRLSGTVGGAISALESTGSLPEGASMAAREIGKARALMGVPIETVLESWSTAERVCIQHLLVQLDALPGSDLRTAVTRVNAVFREQMRLCAEEYSRTTAEVTIYYDRVAADLVSRLLGKKRATPEEIRSDARSIGVDSAQHHLVLVVPEVDIDKRLRVERHVLSYLASTTDSRILVGRMERQLVILYPPGAMQQPDIMVKLNRCIQEGRTQGLGPILISTSTNLAPLDRISTHCAQAQEAAEVAKTLGLKDRLVTFEELSLEIMLQRSLDTTTALRGSLQPIEDRPDLIETLSAYYQNGLSARQTARALYLHHNTVAYRLGRIEELLNRKLEDVTSSIDLLIALHTLRN